MNELTIADARAWMDRFVRSFERERAALAELDRRAGDGDFGTNLASALRRVGERIDAGPAGAPGELFLRVSEGFLNTGGTSGPLFGMWFRELGRALADGGSAARVAHGFAAGVATVRRLGKASPGDKTMVDAMAPAAEAMRGADLTADLAAAAEAARTGADSTQHIRARRGRSTYVGDVAVGVLDPGAVTVALFFEAGVPGAGRA